MNKLVKKIIIIVGALLVVSLGILLIIKLTSPKDKGNEDKKQESKILYTFTDPLNNKINIVYKEILDEKYMGVDLSRFDDKEDELRKEIKEYVYKDSDVKALNLSEDYNEAYDKLLRKIRGRNGSGFSLEGVKNAIVKEGITSEAAEYVVNNANIDYNDQALMVVYKRLETGHSKESIKNKLVDELFTEEEIGYAMNEIKDVDFYEQALADACYYRFYKKYDKAQAARYLRLEKFTEEENEYAVNIVYEKIK